MMADTKKRGLGRGLSALMPDGPPSAAVPPPAAPVHAPGSPPAPGPARAWGR